MPRHDLAAIQREWRYHREPLPAFPGVLFTVAVEIATQRFYWAVDEVCTAVGLVAKAQRERLTTMTNVDGEPMVRVIPMWTPGGIQDKVAIEFKNLGEWLIMVQENRTTGERAQRLQEFRRLAFKVVNLVIAGKIPAITLKLPRGRPSLLDQLEERVSETERELAQVIAVQAADAQAFPANSNMMQALATCPHCGGPILVQAGSLEVVAPAPDDVG